MKVAACRALERCFFEPYGAVVNRWLITVILIGLVVGFAGVFAHNDRALILGIVLSLGGIWAAIGFR